VARHRRTVAIAVPELRTGGIGSFVSDLAAGLLRRGWGVDVVATDARGDLHGALGPEVGYHDLAGVPLSRRKVFEAARLLGRLAPGAVVTNHAPLLHYALPLLGEAPLALAVLHSDDPRYYHAALRMRGRVFRWVAPSGALAARCREQLPAALRHRVVLVRHGVAAEFHPRGRPSPGGGGPGRVVFVGHLGVNKGADLLPAIMRRVWERRPGAVLVVVGEGPLRPGLEAELAAETAAGRCLFRGALARPEVARELRGADVLLLPTRGEGFGLAIAEAMACGAVPVATRLAGVTDEVVADGRTGFLVARDDAEGFALAVAGVLGEPVLLARLSAAAQREARGRHGGATMLDAWERLLAAPDDRAPAPPRGVAGWALETAVDAALAPFDPAWVARRVRGFLGSAGPRGRRPA